MMGLPILVDAPMFPAAVTRARHSPGTEDGKGSAAVSPEKEDEIHPPNSGYRGFLRRDERLVCNGRDINNRGMVRNEANGICGAPMHVGWLRSKEKKMIVDDASDSCR